MSYTPSPFPEDKLPQHLQIAGKRVPLIVRDDLTKEEDTLAQFDPDRRVIEIDRSVLADRRLLRDWLVHESLHAALSFAGLSATVSDRNMDYDIEESIVNAVESLGAPVIVRIYRLFR